MTCSNILIRNLRLGMFISLIIAISSCNLDQIEKEYTNFEAAEKDELFKKGWIPKQLISDSMENIYLRSNLDLNTCIFSFKISESDSKNLIENLTPGCSNIENIKRIKIPPSWINTIPQLDQYIFFDPVTSDTIHIAVDKNENIIYGWRE